jgi:hypothetical protein
MRKLVLLRKQNTNSQYPTSSRLVTANCLEQAYGWATSCETRLLLAKLYPPAALKAREFSVFRRLSKLLLQSDDLAYTKQFVRSCTYPPAHSSSLPTTPSPSRLSPIDGTSIDGGRLYSSTPKIRTCISYSLDLGNGSGACAKSADGARKNLLIGAD